MNKIQKRFELCARLWRKKKKKLFDMNPEYSSMIMLWFMAYAILCSYSESASEVNVCRLR